MALRWWLVVAGLVLGQGTVIMHVKLTIRYQDGVVTPCALVAMLKREVVRVIYWAAPHSRWGVDDDGGTVAPGIPAPSARDRFQAAVAALACLHSGLTSSCQVAFERLLGNSSRRPVISNLVFDMSAIRFMGHWGFPALDAHAQKCQAPVIVRSPPPIVRRTAGLAGLELFDSAHPGGL
jgi:anti-anti-sigma regulatory factor